MFIWLLKAAATEDREDHIEVPPSARLAEENTSSSSFSSMLFYIFTEQSKEAEF